ncbi:tol-pal system YbgF family protein, partial [Actinoplanes sp. NPDC051343]|uniref:tol-pal system YbgF family protein n=1 Tax=Actinoplanes sp. NPDC051343 TaxID=3363906 RepID=UPI00378FD486
QPTPIHLDQDCRRDPRITRTVLPTNLRRTTLAEVLHDIVARDPSHHAAAAWSLGRLLDNRGRDSGEARAAFELAIATGHAHYAPWAAYALGEMLARTGDIAGAQRNLQRALDSGHDQVLQARSAFRLGMLLAAQDEFGAAREMFERAGVTGHENWAPWAAYKLGSSASPR